MSDTARNSTPGVGWCGCQRPDQHHDGCLWGLDLESRVLLAARLIVSAVPVSSCLTCGTALDGRQVRQHVLWDSPACAALWAGRAA